MRQTRTVLEVREKKALTMGRRVRAKTAGGRPGLTLVQVTRACWRWLRSGWPCPSASLAAQPVRYAMGGVRTFTRNPSTKKNHQATFPRYAQQPERAHARRYRLAHTSRCSCVDMLKSFTAIPSSSIFCANT